VKKGGKQAATGGNDARAVTVHQHAHARLGNGCTMPAAEGTGMPGSGNESGIRICIPGRALVQSGACGLVMVAGFCFIGF